MEQEKGNMEMNNLKKIDDKNTLVSLENCNDVKKSDMANLDNSVNKNNVDSDKFTNKVIQLDKTEFAQKSAGKTTYNHKNGNKDIEHTIYGSKCNVAHKSALVNRLPQNISEKTYKIKKHDLLSDMNTEIQNINGEKMNDCRIAKKSMQNNSLCLSEKDNVILTDKIQMQDNFSNKTINKNLIMPKDSNKSTFHNINKEEKRKDATICSKKMCKVPNKDSNNKILNDYLDGRNIVGNDFIENDKVINGSSEFICDNDYKLNTKKLKMLTNSSQKMYYKQKRDIKNKENEIKNNGKKKINDDRTKNNISNPTHKISVSCNDKNQIINDNNQTKTAILFNKDIDNSTSTKKRRKIASNSKNESEKNVNKSKDENNICNKKDAKNFQKEKTYI